MKTRKRSIPKRQIEAERGLLAALLQQTLKPATRGQVLEHFAARTFAHPEHQILFWALSQLPAREPAIIREVLGTRLTVMGFPDLDVNGFFDNPPPSEHEIPALLQWL